MELDTLKIVRHYLIAALWTNELDSEYDVEDFTKESVLKATNYVKDFLNRTSDIPFSEILDEEQIGHDLWLTSECHGVGFWARDHKYADILTDRCLKTALNLSTDNEGQIHLEGSLL